MVVSTGTGDGVLVRRRVELNGIIGDDVGGGDGDGRRISGRKYVVVVEEVVVDVGGERSGVRRRGGVGDNGGGGGVKVRAEGGSLALVSVLVAAEGLGGVELPGTVTAGEHARGFVVFGGGREEVRLRWRWWWWWLVSEVVLVHAVTGLHFQIAVTEKEIN